MATFSPTDAWMLDVLTVTVGPATLNGSVQNPNFLFENLNKKGGKFENVVTGDADGSRIGAELLMETRSV